MLIFKSELQNVLTFLWEICNSTIFVQYDFNALIKSWWYWDWYKIWLFSKTNWWKVFENRINIINKLTWEILHKTMHFFFFLFISSKKTWKYYILYLIIVIQSKYNLLHWITNFINYTFCIFHSWQSIIVSPTKHLVWNLVWLNVFNVLFAFIMIKQLKLIMKDTLFLSRKIVMKIIFALLNCQYKTKFSGFHDTLLRHSKSLSSL